MLHEQENKRYTRRRPLTRHPSDRFLLLSVLILIGVGCYFIYDFTVVSTVVPRKNYYLIRQTLYAVCGLFCIWIVSRIDYHHLARFTAPLWIVMIVLQIFSFAAGKLSFVQRDIPYLIIGALSIHMGQITGFAVLLFLAQILARIDLNSSVELLYFFFALSVCLLSAFSYGAGIALIPLITLSIMYSLKNKRTLLTSLSLFAAMFLMVLYTQHLYPGKASKWRDPFSDPQGFGLAAIQSIYAIADGGAFGVGVGNGTMRYAVEDVHSIFMLPAIAQEIGLIGVFVILLVYFFFLTRAFIIAAKAVDRFGFYLAAAIMTYDSVRFALAILNSTNAIPWGTGLTLPFLSYGGGALILDCTLVGILLSIGSYQVESARR